MQSLLQGLPIQAQSYSYQEPGALGNLLGMTGGISQLYDILFGGSGSGSGNTTPAGDTVVSGSSGTADDVANEGGLE